jgi:cobalt-zinc-cadmium efflux system membrane fusion protein
VGGPVSRILVAPGEQVTAGQPMLYVTSPDYSSLRSTYLKARDALQLAKKQYARAQDLYAHQAIAQADVETAESAQTQAQADFDSSADAMRVVGISDPESLLGKPVSAELPLLSPMGGEVVERQCAPGQLLQAGATQCFTISDMSSVWVLVNVYQNDLAYVHDGQEVSIENESYPGVIRGKIQYIAPALDPATRTLQARIECANPGDRLKKEMYVTALVDAGVIPRALTVPDSAILRDAQNMPYVYVQTGNNQFGRRDVTIGDSRGGKTLITSGLQTGERLVGDGALFLQFQNSIQR